MCASATSFAFAPSGAFWCTSMNSAIAFPFTSLHFVCAFAGGRVLQRERVSARVRDRVAERVEPAFAPKRQVVRKNEATALGARAVASARGDGAGYMPSTTG